jgi:hypothetical protein
MIHKGFPFFYNIGKSKNQLHRAPHGYIRNAIAPAIFIIPEKKLYLNFKPC